MVGVEGRLTTDSMSFVAKLTEGGLLSKMVVFLVNQTFQQTVAGSEGYSCCLVHQELKQENVEGPSH